MKHQEGETGGNEDAGRVITSGEGLYGEEWVCKARGEGYIRKALYGVAPFEGSVTAG